MAIETELQESFSPCGPERTFRRLLKKVDPEQLKAVLVGWMQTEDPAPLRAVHADGKVVKNAQPAPPRCPVPPWACAPEPCEIPLELQNPSQRTLKFFSCSASGSSRASEAVSALGRDKAPMFF